MRVWVSGIISLAAAIAAGSIENSVLLMAKTAEANVIRTTVAKDDPTPSQPQFVRPQIGPVCRAVNKTTFCGFASGIEKSASAATSRARRTVSTRNGCSAAERARAGVPASYGNASSAIRPTSCREQECRGRCRLSRVEVRWHGPQLQVSEQLPQVLAEQQVPGQLDYAPSRAQPRAQPEAEPQGAVRSYHRPSYYVLHGPGF